MNDRGVIPAPMVNVNPASRNRSANGCSLESRSTNPASESVTLEESDLPMTGISLATFPRSFEALKKPSTPSPVKSANESSNRFSSKPELSVSRATVPDSILHNQLPPKSKLRPPAFTANDRSVPATPSSCTAETEAAMLLRRILWSALSDDS